MKIIKRLCSKTLTAKFFNTIYWTYEYVKDINYIGDTLYSKEFSAVIQHYLDTDIHKDWIGRLYAVVNPNITNGKYDFNKTIIEIDGDNTNNTEYIKHWVYKQLNLISDLFKINKLYDYINLEFRHVGPENADNYLIVFDVISRIAMARYFKSTLKHLFVYALIALVIFITKIYIF